MSSRLWTNQRYDGSLLGFGSPVWNPSRCVYSTATRIQSTSGGSARSSKPELPATDISLSSEVAPEFREYLCASTTVINAGVQLLVDTYLTGISARLAAAGINSPLLIMQSGGSVMTTGAAHIRPVFMLESGPAAGAVAAAHRGRHIERPNVISLDMGGTTAKVCLIEHGQPTVTREYQVGQQTSGGTSAFGGASGYPVRTPVVDLVEIGAGGGSVAWVDSGGALRVGPQSAGADPGPAC